jgi:hypothetical protein
MSQQTIPAQPPPQGSDDSTSGDPTAMADEVLVVGGAVPFDKTTPEQENVFHHYTGNAIPWFVRGIWILFGIYAIAYVIVWLLPALQNELLSPP